MRTPAVLFALLLAACAPLAPPRCEPVPRVYEAREIGQEWIDYVWVELPPEIALDEDGTLPDSVETGLDGTVPGRLFVASADPVGVIVPTMIDLPCAGEPVEYAPAPVEFEIEAGTAPTGAQYGRWSPDAPPPERLKTSYGWGSCASCSECYMQWTFSLDLEGQLEDGALVADLVLNETFHSGPMPIVSVTMRDVTAACTEPRLTCEADGTCSAITYEAR
jgi:hypothetical protein